MKIFNTITGSFFRTIGRMLAYAFIGFLLFLCFSKIKLPKINDISDTINWSWFFGVQKVNASTYVTNVVYGSTGYLTQTDNVWTSDDVFYRKTISPNNSIQRYKLSFQNMSSNSDYLEFNFLASQPNTTTSTYQTTEDYCERWEYGVLTTNENVLRWDCARYDTNTNDFKYARQSTITGMNFYFYVDYSDGSWANCETVENNFVMCPISGKNINGITALINYSNNNSANFEFAINRIVNYYVIDNSTSNAINSQTNTITNNQNQNTQQIINNQEANTNATIENQNQNTDQTINSQKVCIEKVLKYSDKVTDGYINTSDGNIAVANNWGVTDYLELNKLEILTSFASTSSYSCFYNENKVLISCITANTSTGIYNLPNNTKYARFSIRNNDVPEYKVSLCKNGNQAMSDTITSTDTNEADNKASGFFDNFSTSDQGGLSGIITAPLSAIQTITSATCSPLVIPLPFLENQNLSLPCMRSIYESFFGGFMTIYDTITLGIISYWVLVRLFNLVKDFKNPEHDEIEVVDL